MITTFLINLGLGIVELFIQIFPTSTGFSDTIVTQLSELGNYIAIINPIFPLDAYFTMLGIVFSTDAIIWTFNFIRKMSSHIPVVGGSGK